MKKILITDYKKEDGSPYNVRQKFLDLLFGKHLNLDYQGLLDREIPAKKIRAAKESVLLEDAEYEILKVSVTAFSGYLQDDLEMVKRVMEAEPVEVVEAVV